MRLATLFLLVFALAGISFAQGQYDKDTHFRVGAISRHLSSGHVPHSDYNTVALIPLATHSHATSAIRRSHGSEYVRASVARLHAVRPQPQPDLLGNSSPERLRSSVGRAGRWSRAAYESSSGLHRPRRISYHQRPSTPQTGNRSLAGPGRPLLARTSSSDRATLYECGH